MLKRAFEVFRLEGFLSFARKTRRYLTYRFVNAHASGLDGGVNGSKYWDLRMRRSWRAVGGHEQTQTFAISMLANLDLSGLKPSSILDFGCATGDSAPILHTAFPESTIFLHDVSPSGVKAGLRRYGPTLPVKAWGGEPANLVYSSNVLEHFSDPFEFFKLIAQASPEWVIVQCPWEETHADGSDITPEAPNGEHFQTVDQAFLDEYLPKTWRVEQFVTATVPFAWPFGKQLFLVLRAKNREN